MFDMFDDVKKWETEKLSRLISGYEAAVKAAQEEDYKAAYETLISGILPTEAIDQYNWGTIYFNGNGIEKDRKKAFEWFQKASDKGYAEAATVLGWMYLNGESVEKNSESALHYLTKAADAGEGQAMRVLGEMYRRGEGVEKNCELAMQWIEKAAERGEKTSKYILGDAYYRGTTLPRSFEKARRWLDGFDVINYSWIRDEEKALYCLALCLLGMMNLHGKGVPRDDTKALSRLRFAAENGNGEAQFWLGFQYVRGLGVDLDYKEGGKWLQESAKNGFEEAVRLQEAAHKREFLDEIWEKAKAEARLDRTSRAQEQKDT